MRLASEEVRYTSSKKCVTHNNYSVNNVPLSQVDKVRDLGIIVDSSLKFDKHVSLIVHKAMNRSRLILKCFQSRDRIVLTKAFCTCSSHSGILFTGMVASF